MYLCCNDSYSCSQVKYLSKIYHQSLPRQNDRISWAPIAGTKGKRKKISNAPLKALKVTECHTVRKPPTRSKSRVRNHAVAKAAPRPPPKTHLSIQPIITLQVFIVDDPFIGLSILNPLFRLRICHRSCCCRRHRQQDLSTCP